MTNLFDDQYCDWKNWDPKNFGTLTKHDEVYFDAELKKGSVKKTADLRVLELGFGSGRFLAYLKKFTSQIVGVEVNEVLLNRAQNLNYRVYTGIDLVPKDETFDLIVAFDVLEHLPQEALFELFKAVNSRLAVGGIFLTRFPNGDSPFGRLYQHGDLTHVTTIGGYKIEALAQLNHLEVVYCGAPSLPTRNVGFALAAKRIVASVVKRAVEYPLRKLYFGGRNINFDVNMIAILKKTAK